MVLTMHGGGTPQSTSQAVSVAVYVRKKALNPGRKIECTRVRMMGKPPDVQIWNPVLNMKCGIYFGKVGGGGGGGVSETLKRLCVDICCLHEVRWKGQGAKMIGNGFKFLWRRGGRL